MKQAQQALLLLLTCGAATASSADWPGFRGPADEHLAAASVPLAWGPDEGIKWTADLTGTGQSSPIVWKDHVYITTVEGPNKEVCHVTAYHLGTGEKLWQGSLRNASPQENSNYVSKAAPTAVADEAGVIALFEGGNLIALGHDGTRRWDRNLVEESGPIQTRHGLGSSLLQTRDRVFVWIERDTEPYLLAIDKGAGTDIWKAPGLGAASWSTPVLLNVDGTTQIVLSGLGTIQGRALEDGHVLWTLDGAAGNATPSPTVVGEGLLLLGATDGRGEAEGGRAAESNGLVRVAKSSDGTFTAEFAWRARRATCSFGSPIAHQGLAYFVNRSGVVFCLDLETGEEVYAERTPESCWATPLAIEDRIYFVGQRGTTTVIRPGRKFEVLAQNRLWEGEPAPAAGGPPLSMGSGKIEYAVAAVPGYLLIRTGEQLFCVGGVKR